MIYITGDCHGDFKRFNKKNFPEQLEMTKDDFVIISVGMLLGVLCICNFRLLWRHWLCGRLLQDEEKEERGPDLQAETDVPDGRVRPFPICYV